MTFLSVLFAYLLSRFTAMFNLLHHDAWHTALLARLQPIKPGSLLPFWIMSVGVTVMVGLLLSALPFWWSFLGGILALLFSLGRVDWRQDLPSLMGLLREGRAESVWLGLEAEGALPKTGEDAGDMFWLAWRRHAGRIYLDGLFAVVVWFFLLGPVAAVFYRLTCLYNNHQRVREGLLPSARQWQFVLEWLPVRYMALCVCLAGNFTPGFQVWRQWLLDTSVSSADLLARCLEASLVHDPSANAYADTDEAVRIVMIRNPALVDLLERTEIIGLVGLALAMLVMA